MEFQILKPQNEQPKKSLMLVYQHQYADYCTDATYPLMDTSDSVISVCTGNVFSPEDNKYIESRISDELCKAGLVVLIDSEESWSSSSRELMSDLSSQGIETVSVVCRSETDSSAPYLDKATDASKGVFVIRTCPSWLNRLLGEVLWAYSRPLGVITPSIDALADAFVSLLPRHTDTHTLCHELFEQELKVFADRVSAQISRFGVAVYVFLSITSIDITVDQLNQAGAVLRGNFPSGTRFGIQVGTDKRCAKGTTQLSAMVFFRQPKPCYLKEVT